MMKSGVWGNNLPDGRKWGPVSLLVVFPLVALLFALVLGAALGRLDISTSSLLLGSIILLMLLVLRQRELAVTLLITAHIYVDWYLGLEVVAPTIAAGLLCLFFLARSPRYPWVAPRALWLWILFLVLTIPPVIRGAQGRYDLGYYYPNIVFGALAFFWLGMVVARDRTRLRALFNMLASLGALLALHTIVQTTTGTVLFGSSRFDAVLAHVSDYALAGSSAFRAGSFFVNPDWNGTFLSMMFFLPLGLFVTSASILGKLMYLSEMLLILIALLFTYSIGAWVGCFAGIVVFILFVGRGYYRLLLPLLITAVGITIIIAFPTEINLQLQHARNPVEVSLREGAWETAVHVINAFPLTGVGLGLETYLQRAEPYRVPAQYLPLAHPHNSYLELGAMAGLPVLCVFLALLFFALWLAWHNWLRIDMNTRSALGGGIAAVMALSVNSFSINAWTLPPLAALGWLILGATVSPLLVKNQPQTTHKEHF